MLKILQGVCLCQEIGLLPNILNRKWKCVGRGTFQSKSVLNLYCFLNLELNSIIKDLEQQLQAQEKLKRSHMNKHQETELELDRLKLELTEKDKILNKTRDKLTQTSTQLDQATTQVKCLTQLLTVFTIHWQYSYVLVFSHLIRTKVPRLSLSTVYWESSFEKYMLLWYVLYVKKLIHVSSCLFSGRFLYHLKK